MKTCLIGYTGFIGSSLLKHASFTEVYNSKNIFDIQNKEFDLVVCAGAPGKKWLANSNPDVDRKKIDSLILSLKTVRCDKFILISTVDVFKYPTAVDESSKIPERNLHPYGLHRRILEKFIEQKYKKHLVIRLPGLVGPNLKKNVLFDLLNNNNIEAIDSRNIYQFYPVVNLWKDILQAIELDVSIIHLTAEPISVEEIAKKCFKKKFENHLEGQKVTYDMRTLYTDIFGKHGHYQYCKKESIRFIKQYAKDKQINKKI